MLHVPEIVSFLQSLMLNSFNGLCFEWVELVVELHFSGFCFNWVFWVVKF